MWRSRQLKTISLKNRVAHLDWILDEDLDVANVSGAFCTWSKARLSSEKKVGLRRLGDSHDWAKQERTGER